MYPDKGNGNRNDKVLQKDDISRSTNPTLCTVEINHSFCSEME